MLGCIAFLIAAQSLVLLITPVAVSPGSRFLLGLFGFCLGVFPALWLWFRALRVAVTVTPESVLLDGLLYHQHIARADIAQIQTPDIDSLVITRRTGGTIVLYPADLDGSHFAELCASLREHSQPAAQTAVCR